MTEGLKTILSLSLSGSLVIAAIWLLGRLARENCIVNSGRRRNLIETSNTPAPPSPGEAPRRWPRLLCGRRYYPD